MQQIVHEDYNFEFLGLAGDVHEAGSSAPWSQTSSVLCWSSAPGGEIRLRLVPNTRRHNLEGFIEGTVDDDTATIYTDELASYQGIAGKNHQTIDHKHEQWVHGDVHTNTVESAWSLLKRSIVGTYHSISVKHLPAYLAEMEWRFDERENPYPFRDTLSCSYTAMRCPTTC